MIELNEEARFPRATNDLVHTLFREDAIVAVTAEFVLKTSKIPARIPLRTADVEGIVGIARKEVEMKALLIPPIGRGIVDGILHRGERDEILIRQIGIIMQYLVIGIGNDVVAMRHIALFDLLRSERAVGKTGVTMQVGFALFQARIDQVFHSGTSMNLSNIIIHETARFINKKVKIRPRAA